MEWDKGNKYCFKTWTALKIIGEIHHDFSASSSLLVKNFSCWQQGINEKQLKKSIEKTVKKFDETLRTVSSVSYNNLKQNEVLSKLRHFFSEPHNSIIDLVLLVSKLYKLNEPLK